MDYETAVSATVSRARAKSEVERHGLDFADFVAEVGDAAEYQGSAVLAWLGY